MKKHLLLPIFLLGLFSACRDDTPKPEPEPDEYFSFYADGVYYNYPQVKKLGFDEKAQTLEAKFISATVGYQITGMLKDNPRGRIKMTIFPMGHIPDQDTVELNHAVIYDFLNFSHNYKIAPPLRGKIIFTERTYMRLTGTFEFQAYKYVSTTGELTDTIITITDGKFSIIPTR